jgi:hypothetical protein
VSQPARTAATLRWHAIGALAAVIVMIAALLTNQVVDVKWDVYGATAGKTFRAFHLGVCAPAWLFVAWQELALFRRAPARSRALLVAAACAIAAAGAAIATELLLPVVIASHHGGDIDWVGTATLGAAITASGWLVAASIGRAHLAAYLARGTLTLPTVRLRENALHLSTVTRALPWTLALGFLCMVFEHPVVGIVVAGAGTVGLTVVELAIADLVARSRALPSATVLE